MLFKTHPDFKNSHLIKGFKKLVRRFLACRAELLLNHRSYDGARPFCALLLIVLLIMAMVNSSVWNGAINTLNKHPEAALLCQSIGAQAAVRVGSNLAFSPSKSELMAKLCTLGFNCNNKLDDDALAKGHSGAGAENISQTYIYDNDDQDDNYSEIYKPILLSLIVRKEIKVHSTFKERRTVRAYKDFGHLKLMPPAEDIAHLSLKAGGRLNHSLAELPVNHLNFDGVMPLRGSIDFLNQEKATRVLRAAFCFTLIERGKIIKTVS